MRHPLDTTPDDAPLEEIIATGGFSDISRYEHAAEHQRLKDAVVEAAKAYYQTEVTFEDAAMNSKQFNDRWKRADELDAAIATLIQFESKEG